MTLSHPSLGISTHAISLEHDLKIQQMDITTAYLHDTVEEEIYVIQTTYGKLEKNRISKGQ